MAINGKAKDLTGQTFGYWNVIGFSEVKNKHGHRHFDCECVCGIIKSLRGSMLTMGTSISCGCITRKGSRHMMSRSRTYKSWVSMKSRCLNENTPSYINYGGRGISICERWVYSFENFIEDLGERPENTSIERIDVNGNYEPLNCRWATNKEQDENKTVSNKVLYNGEMRCITGLCRQLGVSRSTMQKRIATGMSFDEAIKSKSNKPKYLIYMNDENPVNKEDFFKDKKIPSTTISRWVNKGKTLENAIYDFLVKNGFDIFFFKVEKDENIKLTPQSKTM
jgi:hypothetical protein